MSFSFSYPPYKPKKPTETPKASDQPPPRAPEESPCTTTEMRVEEPEEAIDEVLILIRSSVRLGVSHLVASREPSKRRERYGLIYEVTLSGGQVLSLCCSDEPRKCRRLEKQLPHRQRKLAQRIIFHIGQPVSRLRTSIVNSIRSVSLIIVSRDAHVDGRIERARRRRVQWALHRNYGRPATVMSA